MSGGWTALVLAASEPGDKIAKAAGVPSKLLIDLGGVTMLGGALAALAAAPSVGRVIVATDDMAMLDGLEPRPDAAQAAGGPLQTVQAAYGQLGPPLLIVDLAKPLLTSGDIEGFVSGLGRASAGLAVVSETTIEGAYPVRNLAAVAFADAAYVGAGLYGLAREDARQAMAALEKIDWEAKNLIGALRPLDPFGGLLMSAGRLSLSRAMARLSRRIGAVVTAVESRSPELALEIRAVADLAHARRSLLGRRLAAGPQGRMKE